MAGGKNSTTITEFILLGFSEFPQLTAGLFSIFLGIYLATVSWNLGLIALIRMDSRLHTPMYFFLSNLSLLDTCYVSTIAPRMLPDFFRTPAFTSFPGCATQPLLFSRLGLTECCLLAAMAYDRYVAIAALCSAQQPRPPLSACRRWQDRAELDSSVRSFSCVPYFSSTSVAQMLPITSSATCPILLGHLVLSSRDVCAHSGLWLMSASVIMMPCGCTVATIVKVASAGGQPKASNTCASHVTAVALFFGSGIFVYMHPNSGGSSSQNKLASVLYTVIIPTLNPLIYSLRNKEIKDALNVWKRKVFSWCY